MTIQAIRGMKDLLPEETALWQQFEASVNELMSQYAYHEIRMPLLEKTELFKRGIGEVTDIVEKEMYTFADRNGESLTLRPEGTASCVRAVLEHGLSHHQSPKLWYYGPMFRYERPQQGRFRQFNQLGVEVFGLPGPDVDAEQVVMMDRLWRKWGIRDKITLQINSLGTPSCRASFRSALVGYFEQNLESLDKDSLNRLHTNPLRILDSKNPDMQPVIQGAPKLSDFLSDEATHHFTQFKTLLDSQNIEYVVNPQLVRGLDYYTLTVYEWVTDSLGAQGTVCGGGRYDGLVEMIGGKPTPAVGFAMGIERVMSLIQLNEGALSKDTVDAYAVVLGERAQAEIIHNAEKIRDQLPKLRMLTHFGEGSVKSQFKKADKCGARLAFVFGDDEVANATVTVKFLREEKAQQTFSLDELAHNFPEYSHNG